MAEMSKTNDTPKKESNLFAILVIPVCLLVCILIYKYVFGDPNNFVNNDLHNNPKEGNYFGIVYKGGPIVPVLMTLFLIVVVYTIERMLTLSRAKGNGNVDDFLKSVKQSLDQGNLTAVTASCDKQKGIVANVVKATVHKYHQMENEQAMTKDQKVIAIQKEVEEATSLELPMLEKNLVFLATIASVATLVGLLGTVIGMIKAFAALAIAGNPDATALATGISEALINTALGILTSSIAIIMYNVFTTRIDGLTYRIDEAGVSIAQTFAAKH